MWLAKKIFLTLGWQYKITIDLPNKCVACIAPHTSNWDFLYGMLFKKAYDMKINFFIKKEWMRFPFGWFIKRMGGIPIHRDKAQSTTDVYAREFARHNVIRIGITPEGTRSARSKWKLGFYYIALKAGVPIILVSVDYKKKLIKIDKQIIPNGEVEEQLAIIKAYYKGVCAKYPSKFHI